MRSSRRVLLPSVAPSLGQFVVPCPGVFLEHIGQHTRCFPTPQSLSVYDSTHAAGKPVWLGMRSFRGGSHCRSRGTCWRSPRSEEFRSALCWSAPEPYRTGPADRKVRTKRIYGVSKIEDARQVLADHTSISEDRKSGIITITVTDHDPKRAAELAQAYINELDQLVAQVSTSSARRERIFRRAAKRGKGRSQRRSEKV